MNFLDKNIFSQISSRSVLFSMSYIFFRGLQKKSKGRGFFDQGNSST